MREDEKPAAQGPATREHLLAVALRLFAEHGIAQVSNRRVALEAGTGNNYAVGYHFGSRRGLIKEILGRHQAAVEPLRAARLAQARRTGEAGDYVGGLILPLTEHLAALPVPTFYARFVQQALADPDASALCHASNNASPSVTEIRGWLRENTEDLAPAVLAARSRLITLLATHTCAQHEAELHHGSPRAFDSWQEVGAFLTASVTGLLAPPRRAACA
ncbi:TetR/AcrR family transcriptional regulator [Streptomyces avicenniae]|uniref:TetR/AcrR family transcriptional regulator n=1 Tax=Streptomyces avicenniae TaxID=500153 RepID=UPI00069AD415|nr:helix-turn-helix domain-containing protein [Streptomyces avicenniae]